jgi:hypothetical protein
MLTTPVLSPLQAINPQPLFRDNDQSAVTTVDDFHADACCPYGNRHGTHSKVSVRYSGLSQRSAAFAAELQRRCEGDDNEWVPNNLQCGVEHHTKNR